MSCLVIGLLAVTCIALYISIINTRGEHTFKILILLLAHEEAGCDGYLEISHGNDPRAIQKLLNTLVKQGYLDQQVIAIVEARKPMRVRRLYRLTPAGQKFAKLLKAKFFRRKR